MPMKPLSTESRIRKGSDVLLPSNELTESNSLECRQLGRGTRQLGQKVAGLHNLASLPVWNLIRETIKVSLLFGNKVFFNTKNRSRQHEEFHENNAIILNRYDAVCCRYKCWYPGSAGRVSSTNRFA